MTRTYNNAKNLDRSQRLSRFIMAFALLGITVTVSSGALGWMSVLPLAAIYPLVTAFIGWDPVYDMFDLGDSESGHLSTVSRSELAITGTALVGSVFVLPEYAPVCTLLALSGVFPMISAIIGEDMLQSVTPHYQPVIPQVESTVPQATKSKAKAIAAIDEVRESKEHKVSARAA